MIDIVKKLRELLGASLTELSLEIGKYLVFWSILKFKFLIVKSNI